MTVPHIVLHGPESTGKSTLISALALHFGAAMVPEFGRSYCEMNGIALTPDDLRAIFEGHVAMTALARGARHAVLLSDTDPLMTQAWSVMLFGERIAAIDAWTDTADFYLVPALDLPWQDDGTRMFGTADARQRFYDIALRELERRGLRWAEVRGQGTARLCAAIRAIDDSGVLADYANGSANPVA